MTRLVSRLGRDGALTGIDRVEREWLRHLRDKPHLLLCRSAARQLLLPPEAGHLLDAWLDGADEGLPSRPGLRARLARLKGRRGQVARALARLALASAPARGRGFLARGPRRLVRRALAGLGPAARYLNLGHANLDAGLLDALGPLRPAVLIHDTIPLDYPEYSRPEPAARFGRALSAAFEHAAQILTISEASRADLLRWQQKLRIISAPPVIACPIGTRLAAPVAADIPPPLPPARPYFVALGTIEPRKNHALLLDVWDLLATRMAPEEMPHLLIIGSRGWRNEAVFARLDALAADARVSEHHGLSDGAVAALLEGAHGLLMPSHAEGFGLPLTEAAARGVPVITTPIPAAREVLGEYARYLAPDDMRGWAGAVALLASATPRRRPALHAVEWDQHFSQLAGALNSCDSGAGKGTGTGAATAGRGRTWRGV